jgi:hypothetical protein
MEGVSCMSFCFFRIEFLDWLKRSLAVHTLWLILASPLLAAAPPQYQIKVAPSVKLNSGVVLKASDLQRIANGVAPTWNNWLADDLKANRKVSDEVESWRKQFEPDLEQSWKATGLNAKTVSDDIAQILQQNAGKPELTDRLIKQKYGQLFEDVIDDSGLDRLRLSRDLLAALPDFSAGSNTLPILDPTDPSLNLFFIGAGSWRRVWDALAPMAARVVTTIETFPVIARDVGPPATVTVDATGRFELSSTAYAALASSGTLLMASVLDTDPRTRNIRAEVTFQNIRHYAAAQATLGYSSAGSHVRLSVSDGARVLCHRHFEVAWQGTGFGWVRARGEFPSRSLECSFRNPFHGSTARLSVAVEARVWSTAGGIAVSTATLRQDDTRVVVREAF